MREPKRPHGPAHHFVFPGLTSREMESIVEMSPEIDHMAELGRVVSTYAPALMEPFTKLEAMGVTEVQVAVAFLALTDAKEGVRRRGELYEALWQGRAIILLPLPPHLKDIFLALAKPERVFATENEPREPGFPSISLMPLSQMEKLSMGVETIVLEGYTDGDKTLVRARAADIIHHQCANGLKSLFIHNVPHLPHHERFVELTTAGIDLKISTI